MDVKAVKTGHNEAHTQLNSDIDQSIKALNNTQINTLKTLFYFTSTT